MSNLALKILNEFRALPGAEQRELAATIATEVRHADTAGRLRLLDEVTAKYRCEEGRAANLDDDWADGILAAKRTA